MKLPLPPLPGPLPDPVWDLIIYGGKKLLDKFLGNETDTTPSYSPENSEADELMAVNTALFEYREEVKQAAADLESEVLKICEQAFAEVLESLEEANEKCDFYRSNSLKRKLEYFLQDLDSVLDNRLTKRISLDDAECMAILKMRPSESKEQRMREFKEKVFKESIDEITFKLNRFTNEFFEDMESSVNHRLDELEELLGEKVTALGIAADAKAEHSNRLESTILHAEYVMDIFAVSQRIPQ